MTNDNAAEALPFAAAGEDVVAALASDAASGLTAAEASARLARFGPNALESTRRVSSWRKLASQFTDGLVLLLVAAAVVSALLWSIERNSPAPFEAIAILAIVLLNAAMGFVQQERADRAAAALRRMAAQQCSVTRDAKVIRVPAEELVPGDVAVLNEGDTIAADGRLLDAACLQVMEAPLTGESVPVIKSTAAVSPSAVLGDRTCMVFSGTAVTCGHGKAVVTATGTTTEIGRIAGLLASARDVRTPLQVELDKVSKWLGAAVIVIGAIMIGTLLMARDVAGMSAVLEIFILGVALAVAAVPEGLPAIVTAVLAIGVQRMAQRRAIVRTLASVETLGSANVIATDKTGTLTRNEMTVRQIRTACGTASVAGTGYAPHGAIVGEGDEPLSATARQEIEALLVAAERASNAELRREDERWIAIGDPTEAALVAAAGKIGLDRNDLDRRMPRRGELAFSSERKRMSTLHTPCHERDEGVMFTKGAPDVLLELCASEFSGDRETPLEADRRAQILTAVDQMAAQGLRPLGMARRAVPWTVIESDPSPSLESELVFLGLVGIMDPPREEAGLAVAAAQGAGIRVIMITGDHPATASAIAAELGIDAADRVATGASLATASDPELDTLVRRTSVFARVAPEHKLRIVEALRRQGAVVAMTGDGVNDAPALKSADIGVAMGITGTDVAKEAADIVLADDNFATMVAAVEEGRTIFTNIRKFLTYLLSSNIGEVMTMFLGVLLSGLIGLPEQEGGGFVLPLLAVQILWINLVTDGAPALALGVDRAAVSVMRSPPRAAAERVITPAMWRRIVFMGATMAIGTLGILDAALPGGLIAGSHSLAYGQTMAFTTLVLFQLVNAVVTHMGNESIFSARLFSNRWLWLAIGLSLILQLCVVHLSPLQAAFSTAAITLPDWLRCAAVATTIIWLRELVLFCQVPGWPDPENRLIRSRAV